MTGTPEYVDPQVVSEIVCVLSSGAQLGDRSLTNAAFAYNSQILSRGVGPLALSVCPSALSFRSMWFPCNALLLLSTHACDLRAFPVIYFPYPLECFRQVCVAHHACILVCAFIARQHA